MASAGPSQADRRGWGQGVNDPSLLPAREVGVGESAVSREGGRRQARASFPHGQMSLGLSSGNGGPYALPRQFGGKMPGGDDTS